MLAHLSTSGRSPRRRGAARAPRNSGAPGGHSQCVCRESLRSTRHTCTARCFSISPCGTRPGGVCACAGPTAKFYSTLSSIFFHHLHFHHTHLLLRSPCRCRTPRLSLCCLSSTQRRCGTHYGQPSSYTAFSVFPITLLQIAERAPLAVDKHVTKATASGSSPSR